MDLAYKDLFQGEVDLHDSWQVELETICPVSQVGSITTHVQEFYFFIPSSLQISQENYSKEHFYNDRTHFVRQKTAVCTLEELSQKYDWVKLAYPNKPSIFSHVGNLLPNTSHLEIKEHLFLSANIFRSSLRKRTRELFELLKSRGIVNRDFFKDRSEGAIDCVECDEVFDLSEVQYVVSQFVSLILQALETWRNMAKAHLPQIPECSPFVYEAFSCADQYVSTSVDFYLSATLSYIQPFSFSKLSEEIGEVLQSEKEYRSEKYNEPSSFSHCSEIEKETVLYERNWNEKLIRSVLFLTLKKHSFSQRWGHIIASFAAGLAAFLYLFILFWKSTVLVVNSMTFIIASSVLYIFKDRIKEVVKSVFQQQACRFFDDFRTDIYASEKSFLPFGRIKEYYMSLYPGSVPPDIQKLRSWGSPRKHLFIQGQETVLYYRKRISLKREGDWITKTGDKPLSLHTIFRYNIHRLFEKASDPYEEIICYDEENKFRTISFPKVYHINLIVKTVTGGACGDQSLFKKYRIVADKTGIKRIERLYEGMQFQE